MFAHQARLVEAWSIQRLPFQPKGWLADLRDEICKSVKKLESSDGEILHAVYGSASKDLCDAENILFYNVGTGNFASAARHGVRFERSFTRPDPPSLDSHPYPHYHRYALARSDGAFTHWTPGPIWAQWENIEMPALSAFTKASTVWYRMKSSPIEIVQLPASTPDYFGLTITIAVPAGVKARVVDLLKPLLDGLISSLHVHNGAKLLAVSQNLALMLGLSADEIQKLLCEEETAVLGQRCLLWLWSKSVQWNPADDRCLAAEVLLLPYDGTQWRLSGRIFGVESRNQPSSA